jgi:hypothetical protein
MADLRHHAVMGDRYRTADGWAVEVVELWATPDRNDGPRLKVTYCGFFVGLVRTVAELETWFALSDLELEALTLVTADAACPYRVRALPSAPCGLSVGLVLHEGPAAWHGLHEAFLNQNADGAAHSANG